MGQGFRATELRELSERFLMPLAEVELYTAMLISTSSSFVVGEAPGARTL